MRHTLMKHDNCKIPNCPICRGIAKICTTCGCHSPRLTTECPQIKLTNAQVNRVLDGTLNFANGRWIDSRNGDLIDDVIGKDLRLGDTFKDAANVVWVYIGKHRSTDGTFHHHFAESVVEKFKNDKQGYKMLRYMPQLAKLFPEFMEKYYGAAD